MTGEERYGAALNATAQVKITNNTLIALIDKAIAVDARRHFEWLKSQGAEAKLSVSLHYDYERKAYDGRVDVISVVTVEDGDGWNEARAVHAARENLNYALEPFGFSGPRYDDANVTAVYRETDALSDLFGEVGTTNRYAVSSITIDYATGTWTDNKTAVEHFNFGWDVE